MTALWTVDPLLPDAATLAEPASWLAAGRLVAFPTETVYGLGANALSSGAIEALYQAKGRPKANPLIVHVATLAAARALTSAWPDTAEALASRFWPGPLTLVLPHGGKVPPCVTASGETVALRIPGHAVALQLILMAGVPVAAPSANLSGQISPTLPEHVWGGLGGRIDGLVAGGPCSRGVESTVVDLSGARPRLLRPGPLDPAELEAALGLAAGGLWRPNLAVATSDGPRRSPGLIGRHYAPRAPVICLEDASAAASLSAACQQRGEIHAWLALSPGPGTALLPSDPAGAMRSLYRIMHEIDKSGPTCILVTLPPAEGRWLALRDRILRAGLPKD